MKTLTGSKTFVTEKRTLLHKLIGLESVRHGTVALFKTLRSEGHSIYIYTTSFRSVLKIKSTFWIHGITVDKVINQTVHNRELGNQKSKHSKYPPAFGIDIHVDDSPGLSMEGERFGFKTILVKEDDNAWIQTILEEVQSARIK